MFIAVKINDIIISHFSKMSRGFAAFFKKFLPAVGTPFKGTNGR